MNPPVPQLPQLPPDGPQRLADIVEFFARVAGALALVWAFLAKGGKPFLEWNRKRRVEIVREALKKELECIAKLPAREDAVDEKLDLALRRQDQLFERQATFFDEMDLFVNVVADLRDRTDEINDLLDQGPYASRDRRQNSERRRIADDAIDELQGRLKSRRRREDQVKNPEA